MTKYPRNELDEPMDSPTRGDYVRAIAWGVVIPLGCWLAYLIAY